jgi:hypothetical protein
MYETDHMALTRDDRSHDYYARAYRRVRVADRAAAGRENLARRAAVYHAVRADADRPGLVYDDPVS